MVFQHTFNIQTKLILRDAEDLEGVRINGLNINLRHTDDTELMTKNEKKLQRLANVFKQHSSKASPDMKVKKQKLC